MVVGLLLIWILLSINRNDDNTTELTSQQINLKNVNDFNKYYKKLVSKEDKFSSLLFNYQPHHRKNLRSS